MTFKQGYGRRALVAVVLMLAGTTAPAIAQDATQDARLRRIEAEVRALQRQVFPGDGKTFTPQNTPAQATTTVGVPATTPVIDLLARMESVEAQIARLTAQGEENANRLRQIEARLAVPATDAADAQPAASATATPTTTANNLSAMTAGASAPKPAATIGAVPASGAAAATPALTPAPATTAPKPAAKPATPPATTAVTRPAAAPSAQRLAAVRAVEKPQTANAGDDEYSYGYRLWEAKFYPEAQQQLRLYLDKYPRHARVSYARNLLGRAYLDDGKPREAATWFLQNFQTNKQGDRASDSLLYLADSMNRLKDANRACIALAEFGETYPREATGRLRSQYESLRSTVKCN